MQIGNFLAPQKLAFGSARVLSEKTTEKLWKTTPQYEVKTEKVSTEDEKALIVGLKTFLKRKFARGEEAEKIAQITGESDVAKWTVQDILDVRTEKNPLKQGHTVVMADRGAHTYLAIGNHPFVPIEVASKRASDAFAVLAQTISGKRLDCSAPVGLFSLSRPLPSNPKLWHSSIQIKVPDLLELGRKVFAKRALRAKGV